MATETTVVVQGLEEATLGPAWAEHFEALWPAYRRWFLSQGEAERPTYLESRRALRTHMPELVEVYERAVEVAGGSDLVARFLSGYRPPAYIAGCSQAVFRDEFLVRNYDYAAELWDATIAKTSWLRPVIGMSDSGWGLLDGINEDGLAVSLAFGGRTVVGDGFGIPVVLRYVLETCPDTASAVEALKRVPIHMAYNVTVFDAHGAFATVLLSPDRPPSVTERRVITNHQDRVEWHRHAIATGSVDRLRVLVSHVRSDDETAERFVRRFLEPPVYSTRHAAGIGTLYTAVYRPSSRSVGFFWPTARWDVTFEGTLGEPLSIALSTG